MIPERIQAHIAGYYRRFFRQRQQRSLPIQTGRSLASSLGYPVDSFDSLPEEYWEKFVPCGNPLPHMNPEKEDRILNLGCGAGLDSYALSLAPNSQVEVFGLDVVNEILVQASRLSAQQESIKNRLWWTCGDGRRLPFRSESFHWVVMNGVFNLFPDKSCVLKEVHRVLKPFGRIICMDLCCGSALPDYFLEEPDGWAWCMSGASTEDELFALMEEVPLELIRFIREEKLDLLYRVTFICRKLPSWGGYVRTT